MTRFGALLATSCDVAGVASPPESSGSEVLFFEDFVDGDSESRFEFGVYHREDFVVAQQAWPGDHQVTGPDDMCGAPEDTRMVNRGDRESGFNDEWHYRCVPGGDLAKATGPLDQGGEGARAQETARLCGMKAGVEIEKAPHKEQN